MQRLRMGDKEVLDIFREVTERERLTWWQRHKIQLYIYHSLVAKITTDPSEKESETKKKQTAKNWMVEHSDEHVDLKKIVSEIDALVVRPERM